MRRASILALAIIAVAVFVAGCDRDSGDASGVDVSFVSGQGVQLMLPVVSRGEPVALSADTLSGDSLDLASLRGRPVVVNVWYSACPPCRSEAPSLQAAAQQLGTQASFVGVNIRDSDGAAQAYERKFKISYPSLVDHGTLLLSFHGAVAPNQVPTTLILDRQGRVAARFSGPVTERTLIQAEQDVGMSS